MVVTHRAAPTSSRPASSYPGAVVSSRPVARASSATARVVASPRVEPTVPAIAWKRVIGIQAGSRPLVVWIADDVGGATEHRTFDDDSVRLASHAFRTVRITSSAARSDPYLSTFARSAPAMLVFSPDLGRASASYGPTLDARTALEAMRKSAKADMGLDLDAAVARARTLIAEERSVAKQQAALRRTTPVDSAGVAALDRRLAALRAEEDALFRPPAAQTH